MKSARHVRDYLLSKSEKLIDGWVEIIEQATNPLYDIEAVPPDPQLIRALTEAVKLVAPSTNMDIKHDLNALTQQEINKMFPNGEITPASLKAEEIIKGMLSGKLSPVQAKDIMETCDHLFDWNTEYLLEKRINELTKPSNQPKIEHFH